MRSRYDAGLPEPMELKNVRRIGVFKMRNIGDVLMITPVLRALRETFPDARITVIVNTGTEAMLAANPHIDDVIVYRRGEGTVLGREWKFIRDLRRGNFDLTIGFTEGGRTAWCSWLSGARYRFGAAHYPGVGLIRAAGFTITRCPPGRPIRCTRSNAISIFSRPPDCNSSRQRRDRFALPCR